jgi:rhamnogalacturonyl hydrolase YesR
MSLNSAALSHIASSNSSAHPWTDVFKGQDKTDTVEHSLSVKTLLFLYSLTYVQSYVQWVQNLVKVTV